MTVNARVVKQWNIYKNREMARLVAVYRDDQSVISKRELPVAIDDNLSMVMKLNDTYTMYNNAILKGKEPDQFLQKFNLLSKDEVAVALTVTSKELFSILSQTVPCVGCRRSVERLFHQLVKSRFPSLEPLIITADGLLSISQEYLLTPKAVSMLFHVHGSKLSTVVEAIPKSKKNRRCLLHSLDSQRSRPVGNWLDVWESMEQECQEEVVLIEGETLLEMLETYLRKHRFCTECRSKVLRAYSILVGDVDPCKEKGYLPTLYAGIRCCPPENHIHIQCNMDFIAHLITRAEPELMGSRREHHAKTIEIAQEEVLTCLGICIYERLHRIQQRLREEERTCEILFCVGVEALKKNFELAIESKQGISQLELLCEEISKEELAKQQRREHKKQKRKKKKEKKMYQEGEKENSCEYDLEDSPHDSTKNNKVAPLNNILMNLAEENNKENHNHNSKSLENNMSSCSCERKCLMINSSGDNIHHLRPSHDKESSLEHEEKKGWKRSKLMYKSENSISPGCDCESGHESPQHSPSSHQSCRRSAGCCSCASVSAQNGCLSHCSSELSKDCGYSSGNNNETESCSLPSSPDGSEIACSEGFCNHEEECSNVHHNAHSRSCGLGNTKPCSIFSGAVNRNSSNSSGENVGGMTLSLQQMLEESCSSDEESFIPAEEIQEFKSRMRHVIQKRQELRQTLRQRFAQLCIRGCIQCNHPLCKAKRQSAVTGYIQ